tara:strand:+ start:9329 stop:10021 length:693 start_codon:yes stop_codon:yes gene_type:complete
MNGSALPPRNHNQQDPIEAVLTEFESVLDEASNWTDGELITDEAGMKAVDDVLKQFKSYRTVLVKAGKERTDPLHKEWKAEVAAVKIYTDDADLIQKALIAIAAPFKAKLAQEKAAAEKAAWEETNRLRREAEKQATEAREGDVDAQRAANEAKAAVVAAERVAKAAAKEAPKGMRKVAKFEIEDYNAVFKFIAAKNPSLIRAMVKSFVATNHKATHIDGVKQWVEKEAF